MESSVVKFPYTASRRVYSKMPRRSKNGTPEERAARIAASLPPPADVIELSDEPAIDCRKLRGSPLRDHCATISFGATVVGKMHTAELHGEPLAAIDPEIRKEWLATLNRATESVIDMAIGLERAIETLKGLQSEISDFPLNLPDNPLGQSVLNRVDQP